MIKRFAIMAFMIAEILWTGGGPRLSAQPTTKPSFKDTDGDGYPDGPDVVVFYPGLGWRRLIGEDKNGNGKYEPKGEDGILGTVDDEYDPNNPNSHPTVPPMSDDTDGDGLSDELEMRIGTDPMDRDTDDDGLSDGDEYYGIGACFVDGHHFRTNPLSPDTDGDGVPDGTELGVTTPIADKPPIAGTNLSATFKFLDFDGQMATIPSFIPDADGGAIATLMDPLSSDTNGDGIIDGWQDKNKNGALDPGESDFVIGLREDYAQRCSLRSGLLLLYLNDETDPTLYNPPPKRQNLQFYWGSSTAQEASWTAEPSGASPAGGIHIFTNDSNGVDLHRQTSSASRTPIAFEATETPTDGDSYSIRVSLNNGTGPQPFNPVRGALTTFFITFPITSIFQARIIHDKPGNGIYTDPPTPFGEDNLYPIMDIAFGFSDTASFSGWSKDSLANFANEDLGGLPKKTVNDVLETMGFNFALRMDRTGQTPNIPHSTPQSFEVSVGTAYAKSPDYGKLSFVDDYVIYDTTRYKIDFIGTSFSYLPCDLRVAFKEKARHYWPKSVCEKC